MAGSASNWYKPTAGAYAGQAVYIAKATRGAFSPEDVLEGLNKMHAGANKKSFAVSAMIKASTLPKGVAQKGGARRSMADVHAESAFDLIKSQRDMRLLDPKKPDYSRKVMDIQNHMKTLRQRLKDFPPAHTNTLPDLREKMSAAGEKRTSRYGEDYVVATFQELGQTLTREQSGYMRGYINHSYQINNGLRTGNLESSPPMSITEGTFLVGSKHQSPRDVRADVAALDSMVRTIPKGSEISMYRGLDAGVFGDDLQIGTQLRDQGFMSMGFDLNEASSYATLGLESIDATAPPDHSRLPAVLRVNLREDTRVVPTMEFYGTAANSKVIAAEEILMDRDTTLEVTGITEQGGMLIVDTEVVSQRST